MPSAVSSGPENPQYSARNLRASGACAQMTATGSARVAMPPVSATLSIPVTRLLPNGARDYRERPSSGMAIQWGIHCAKLRIRDTGVGRSQGG